MQTALVVLVMLWIVTLLWGLNEWGKNRNKKDALREFLLYHNKVMALYVVVSRQNREIIKTYNQFKTAVRDTFFIPLMGTQDVIDFFSKNKLPQGDLYDEASGKAMVQKFLTDDKSKRKYFKALFD